MTPTLHACALLLSLPAAVAIAPAQQPLSWPDTPAAVVAAAWFQAYAAGTDAAALAFEQTWRTKDRLAARPASEGASNMRDMAQQTGALRAQRVLESDARSIAVLAVSEKLPMPLRVTFELGQEEPRKLQTVAIRPHAGREPRLGTYGDWQDLRTLLEEVLADTELPAVAAAMVVGDDIVDAAVAGLRSIGDEEHVATRSDRFHIGSVTKAMTATMVGALVEQGVLAWDMTLQAALPAVEMRAEYRAVTLAQVLRHRGGIPGYLTMDDDLERRLLAAGSDARSSRAAFVATVLGHDEAVGRAGEHFAYSNAGYAILGHVAEQATDTPWEQLMAQHVFEPLGMQTASIGWPATRERPDQPRGHFGGLDDLRPQGLTEYPLGPLLAPAGDVCCSVEDLARFVSAHLRGLRGEDGLLRAATVAALHDPGPQPGSTYAAGWSLTRVGDRAAHAHNGSAGTFYAQVELVPDADCAAVVLTNVGSIAAPVVDGLVALLRDRATRR